MISISIPLFRGLYVDVVLRKLTLYICALLYLDQHVFLQCIFTPMGKGHLEGRNDYRRITLILPRRCLFCCTLKYATRGALVLEEQVEQDIQISSAIRLLALIHLLTARVWRDGSVSYAKTSCPWGRSFVFVIREASYF